MNSDYENKGQAYFATLIKPTAAHSFLDTEIAYTDIVLAQEGDIDPGTACMWDNEIISVVSHVPGTLTVKRGCADTVPTEHAAGSHIWMLTDQTGTDEIERGAGETIAVKDCPITVGGGQLPVSLSPPDDVTFNYRFIRPYPPAKLLANTAVWYSGAAINDTTGSMNLTWRERNRVTQADQLLGHEDGDMTPEPNTTYTLRIYTTSGTLLREEPGIKGTSFMYQHAKALKDYGYPSSAVDGFATLTTERDEFQSYTGYTIPMHVEPSANPITPVWMNFWQYVQETPYIYNARHGFPLDEGRGLATAARPGDRMSDGYNLVWHWVEWVDEPDGNGGTISVPVDHNQVIATGDFTPWFTLEFGITELETTINVAATSLWDGVRVPPIGSLVGKIAMIEQELVVFKEQHGDTYTIGRGVGDTIPARHIAGIGVVFLDNTAVIDDHAHVVGESVDYRFQPLTFGGLPDPNPLEPHVLAFNSRALRPYNVAQLVVAGRPWYEEAQVLSGAALPITWAWRNRVSQGATAYDHAYPSITPEAGTQAVLTFFYMTPPVNAGDPPVQHILRTVVVDPVYPSPGADANQGFYSYPYSFAQADGAAAGAALGVCGSVVITCAIYTIRGGHAAWEHYWIPIRVPSYPC